MASRQKKTASRSKKTTEPNSKGNDILKYFKMEAGPVKPQSNITLPVPISAPARNGPITRLRSNIRATAAASSSKNVANLKKNDNDESSKLNHHISEDSISIETKTKKVKPRRVNAKRSRDTNEKDDSLIAAIMNDSKDAMAMASPFKYAKKSTRESNMRVRNDGEIEAELEQMARNELGNLCDFPTEDEDENSSLGLNSSQRSENASFVGRAREVVRTVSTTIERDVLNIRVEFTGLRNLCRCERVFAWSAYELPSYLAKKCTPFELIFLLTPTHPTRSALLRAFYRKYTNINLVRKKNGTNNSDGSQRFAACSRRVGAILRFITQTFDNADDDDSVVRCKMSFDQLKNEKPDQQRLHDDENQKSEEPFKSQSFGTIGASDADELRAENNTNECDAFKEHFPDELNLLSKIANRVARRSSSSTIATNAIDFSQSPAALIDEKRRTDLCRENILTFCSLVPFWDISAWSTRDVVALMTRLSLIYMDERVAGRGIRAKIATTLGMIVELLCENRAQKLVDKYISQVAALRVECHALLMLLGGLIRLPALLENCKMRFSFLRIILENVQFNEMNEDVGETLAALKQDKENAPDDNFNDEYEEEEDATPFTREATPGIIKLFVTLTRVVRRLQKQPTTVYVLTQMLDLCVSDAVIRKEHTEILNYVRNLLNDALAFNRSGRLDDVIVRSMSDITHRIGMVVHRRRANDYERRVRDESRYKYVSSSSESSFDDDENNDEENKVRKKVENENEFDEFSAPSQNKNAFASSSVVKMVNEIEEEDEKIAIISVGQKPLEKGSRKEVADHGDIKHNADHQFLDSLMDE